MRPYCSSDAINTSGHLLTSSIGPTHGYVKSGAPRTRLPTAAGLSNPDRRWPTRTHNMADPAIGVPGLSNDEKVGRARS